jgi:hypothetical protein
LDEGSSHGAIIPLTEKDTSMESPGEIKSHQRRERGKRERWVRGKWSRQTSFKGNLSRVEKGTFFNGVTRKAKG